MQIFIDSADPADVRKFADLGIIDGVTTNPSLAAKVGRPYKDIVQELFQIIDGPISLEVLGTTYDEIMREARTLAALNKNVIVKVPLIPEGLKAVKHLKNEGIRTNVTLVFSATQALLAAKAGAFYVSPFIGRIDDISHEGMELIREIRAIFDNYDFDTKILTASVRLPRQITDAAIAGSDIATVPPDVLEKLAYHPLTEIGLKKFLEDFAKSGLEPLA